MMCKCDAIANKIPVFRLASLILIACSAGYANAAEGAHGVYLLGLRAAPGVGITGPEGVYTSSSAYYYVGSLGAGKLLPEVGGNIDASVTVTTPIGLVGISWMTAVEIFGGRLGFSVLQPFGGPTVSAGAVATAPFLPGPLSLGRTDSVNTAGDPAVSAFVGWHHDNFHWSLGVSGFLPFGDYRKGTLANIANHRASADINGALTYADPSYGIDLSSAVGVTFNTENSATRYKTGDEFHLEWAATKYLVPELGIGFMGFHYQQLSADTGDGAVLGAFKGQTTALGGLVAIKGKVGEFPIAANIRVFREVEVKNRLQGTGGYFTISMPLWVAPSASR